MKKKTIQSHKLSPHIYLLKLMVISRSAPISSISVNFSHHTCRKLRGHFALVSLQPVGTA